MTCTQDWRQTLDGPAGSDCTDCARRRDFLTCGCQPAVRLTWLYVPAVLAAAAQAPWWRGAAAQVAWSRLLDQAQLLLTQQQRRLSRAQLDLDRRAEIQHQTAVALTCRP
ncbi:MAG: hypothetical protein KKB13_18010 [Chloroflexi bacterium]|nr:hypothetical protein [Chloroflexota bacterium]